MECLVRSSSCFHLFSRRHLNLILSLLVSRYSKLVALPHSVFALPFALASFIFANKVNEAEGLASSNIIFLLSMVVLAAIGARTAAMSFNRIVDVDYDSKNPRTVSRELPSGEVSVWGAKVLCLFSSLVFIGAAAAIGMHCLILVLPVLLVIFGYSYTKRFSSLSHLVLGLSLALAPGGAWWAIRPTVEVIPLMLMCAVVFWVAGFDTLYSCQDVDFDKKSGLHSIPARFGVANALKIALAFHCLAFLLFVGVGFLANVDAIYFYGMGVIGLIFVGQHTLISSKDLRLINHAFFTFNGMLSLVYFLVVIAAV